MSILRTHKKSRPFVQIDRAAIEDKRLSFRARGLHTYLMSKPDGWSTHLKHLASQSPKEGITAMTVAMRELLKFGYAVRTRNRDKLGHLHGWITDILEYPDIEGPNSDFLSSGKPNSGNLVYSSYSQEEDYIGVKSSPIAPKKEDLTDDEGATYSDDGLSQEEPTEEGEVGTNGELFQEPSTLLTNSEEDGGLRKKTRIKSKDAEEVLAYLNRITGKNYRAPGQIAVRLSQGVTVEELTLVIDYLDATRGVEWKRDWFDQDAPFRKGNFDKNLEKAKGWNERRTPQRVLEPSPAPPALAPESAPAADVDVLDILYHSSHTRSPHAHR